MSSINQRSTGGDGNLHKNIYIVFGANHDNSSNENILALNCVYCCSGDNLINVWCSSQKKTNDLFSDQSFFLRSPELVRLKAIVLSNS